MNDEDRTFEVHILKDNAAAANVRAGEGFNAKYYRVIEGKQEIEVKTTDAPYGPWFFLFPSDLPEWYEVIETTEDYKVTTAEAVGEYTDEEIQDMALPTFAGNIKDDAEKLCGHQGVDLYFPRVLEQLAALSQGGANKYEWDGLFGVEDGVTRYRNAEWRHRQAVNKGEEIDEDISRYSPVPILHQTSRIWNLMAALELELRSEENA